jgi:hypothetical protein
LQTKKPLGCVSCHDPHVKVQPAERVTYYRKSCLACHEQKGCTLAEAERRLTSKEDSCIDCHMPRYPATDIAHTASTNHEIIRKPEKSNTLSPPPHPTNRLPIQLFQKKDPSTYSPEERRDQVLALSKIILSKDPQLAREFLTLAEDAIRENSTDFELWETKGMVLSMTGRDSEALAAFQSGLLYAPKRGSLLMDAAVTAQNLGRKEEALRYWQQAAEINPSSIVCHANISMLATAMSDWPLMKKHTEDWLSLDPGNVDARQARVKYLLHEGNREGAKAEFAKIEALQPKNLTELQAWFRQQTR